MDLSWIPMAYLSCGFGVAEGCVHMARGGRQSLHMGAYLVVVAFWPVFLGRMAWQFFKRRDEDG